MDFLYCPCPAADCTNSDKSPRFWPHYCCGGNTMLRYDDIYIICSRCNDSAIMFDWQFKCANHNFRKSSTQGWLYALSILGQHKGNPSQIHKAVQQLLLHGYK